MGSSVYWNAATLFWADSDQYDEYFTNNSDWVDSWSGLTSSQETNFALDNTHLVFTADSTVGWRHNMPSTYFLYDDGELFFG